MGQLSSPGVLANEHSLNLTIEQLGTAVGGTVGSFTWGPVLERVLVDEEGDIVDIFNKPTTANYKDWMSASNYLAYTNALYMVRVVPTGAGAGTSAFNANATIPAIADDTPAEDRTADANVADLLINNADDFDSQGATLAVGLVAFSARYPGAFGNGIKVSATDSAGFAAWAYKSAFDTAPTGNEVTLIVEIDGEIKEKWFGSKVEGSVAANGGTGYLANLINRGSNYIWCVPEQLFIHTAGTYSVMDFEATLAGGGDGDWGTSEDNERQAGWGLFADAEDLEVDLLFAGGASSVTADWVMDNICDVRQDLVFFASPAQSDVVGVALDSTRITNLDVTRAVFGSTSYAAMDGNYKYQYDRYNDTYRWVPLNGDIAGLFAKTDLEQDAWWAAGGLNRGHIKNVTKLAWSPGRTYRDAMYKSNINPVTIFKGEGPVFWGNRTLQTKPDHFRKLHIRRLFNVLKRSISKSAKYFVFEFNDHITRNRFKQTVNPYLRRVQARRGLEGFLVVCDESNNDAQVRQSDEFVGDIYLKPTHVAEEVYLNFVATDNGVNFDEVTLYNTQEVTN